MASFTLAADAEATYLERTAAMLRRARLNSQFPDARRSIEYLRSMGRAVHGGLYPPLEIDVRSGLPPFREWNRVRADREMAEEILSDLPAEEELATKARRDPRGIHGKQLLKRHYYTTLTERTLEPLDHMEVSLRRIEPGERTAHFHVVLDKLDATGLLVRTTIDLSQRDSVWDHPMVTLDEDTARHTEGLRSLVFRFSSLDAEHLLVRLAGLPNLEVERVVKARAGPFYQAGVRAPEAVRDVLAQAEDGVVATFSLDMAAVDLKRDRDNDPLDEWIGERYSEAAREEYEKARAGYDFRVFKDRKFVVSASLAEAMRAFCAERGTRNVVYTSDG